MASPQVNPATVVPAEKSQGLTWGLTIVACAYIGWIGTALFRATAALAGLFATMNVQLPAITSFAVHNYPWCYPGLFGGAIVLLIAKQFFVRARWSNVVVTFAVVLLSGAAANFLTEALYRPLVNIIEKLNQ